MPIRHTGVAPSARITFDLRARNQFDVLTDWVRSAGATATTPLPGSVDRLAAAHITRFKAARALL